MLSLFFQLFGQICIVSSDTTDCFAPRLPLEIHEKKYFRARLHSLPGAMRGTWKVFRQLSTAEKIPASLRERESKWRELQQQDRGSRWQRPSDSAVWALGLSWAACFLLLETYTDQSPLHQHSPTVGPGAIPSSAHSSAILSSSSGHNWEKKIEVDSLREVFWAYF